MGYSTDLKYFNTQDSNAVAWAAGCLDFTPSILDAFICPTFDELNPVVHFTLESWIDGQSLAANMSHAIRPSLLSMSSYNLDDAYFLWKDTLQSGLDSPEHLALDQYSSYDAAYHKPHKFFDHWSRMTEVMAPEAVITCSDAFTSTDEYVGLLGHNATWQMLEFIRVTNYSDISCSENDTIWFSPACKHNTSECVPLLVMYFLDLAMQRAIFLNLPLAIMLVGPGAFGDYREYLAAIRQVNHKCFTILINERINYNYHLWPTRHDREPTGDLPIRYQPSAEMPSPSRHAMSSPTDSDSREYPLLGKVTKVMIS